MQADGSWTILVVDDDDASRAALLRCCWLRSKTRRNCLSRTC
jgi:hypothetical protein